MAGPWAVVESENAFRPVGTEEHDSRGLQSRRRSGDPHSLPTPEQEATAMQSGYSGLHGHRGHNASSARPGRARAKTAGPFSAVSVEKAYV